MNNKKFIRNIVIAIVVLGILVAAFFIVNKMTAEHTQADENSQNSDTEDTSFEEDITIYSFGKDDVEKITIENQDETITIVKTEDGYDIEPIGSNRYSSALISSTFYGLIEMSAKKEITETDVDFTQTAKATIYTKNGTKEVILGNEVIGENQYFLKYDDKIYVVYGYVFSYFNAKKNNFRATDLGTLSSNIKSVSIDKNGEKYLSFKAAQTEDEANILDVSTSYIMTYPKKMAASEDRIRPLLEKIGQEGYTLSVCSFVEDDISNKAKYNIGKKKVTIEEASQTFTFEFGDKDENGNVYTVLNGNDYIVTIEPSLFDILDSYTPDVIMDKSSHLVLITKIKGVTIEGNNKKFKFEISGKEGSYSYKINSKKIDEDKFKEAYREVIGISVDSMIAEQTVDKKADYTVTFEYLDGKKEVYNYVNYDERNYILTKDKKGEKILLKKRLPEAMKNIENIIK